MSTVGSFVWSIADQLRGVYKPHQYGDVILPMTILRRLDCVLEPNREKVRKVAAAEAREELRDVKIKRATGLAFYNTSPWDFAKLAGDPDGLAANLTDYIAGFSKNIDVFERFRFDNQVTTLAEKNRLLIVVQKFAEVDLHPSKVSNAEMGDLFEELIRKFAEASNETAGEHFTPRDAIRLMVDLLFAGDDRALAEKGVVRTVYDPTAGTGGMLSVAEEHLVGTAERPGLNPDARLKLYGQEINDQSYAICKSDMIAKGQDATNIQLGDTLAEDKFAGTTFDYCLSNPPYGVDWKASGQAVKDEVARAGDRSRFPGGLPSISDGQMLFLQHLATKLRPVHDGGGRAGIVLNGSPLFTGAAESGPSQLGDVGRDATVKAYVDAEVLPHVPDAWVDEKKTKVGYEIAQLSLKCGDVVVVEGGQGGFGRAAFLPRDLDGWGFQNSINRLRPHEPTDGRYLAYYLIALRASGFIHAYCNVVSMPHLTAEKLARLPVPLPPAGAQRAIADYLDHENAQIDTLIAHQDQLIATLRERRNAVVESAVAGIETSGSRLKHVVRSVRQGWSPQCYNWAADGVTTWAVLKAGAANGGVFRPDENKELPAEEAPRPDVVVRGGELLVSRANTRDLVGSAAVVEGDYPRLMLCDKLYAFELDAELALPKFVAAVMGTRRWRDLIEIEATGVSHSMLNVSRSDIVNLPMPLPPVDVQRYILSTLDEQTSRIEALIAKTVRFIELAKQRRTALITAAVTGQIDIREPA